MTIERRGRGGGKGRGVVVTTECPFCGKSLAEGEGMARHIPE